jgi:hypothetical protein
MVALKSISKSGKWKSQTIKIHRLGSRFSIDFKIHYLGYGFLSQSSRALFGNHKHLTKVSRLLFWFGFLEIYKIHRASMDFPMGFWLFCIYFINV